MSEVKLVPLQSEDCEQFIQEKPWAVKDGAPRKVVGRPPFRPMRRFKQALPEEECFRILENALFPAPRRMIL